jgi:molybdenum cofactor cytidylyltransferase
MTPHAVDGIILAAGLSSRMERPKPLLMVGAMTFLERAVQTLRKAECRRIYVVANVGAEWTSQLKDEADIEIVVNEYEESEPVDSVRLALQRVPAETGAILVLPVDLPLISEDTALAVARSFRENPGRLILPFHNGVAGHPVLLGRELFGDILTRPLDEGLRTLIMENARTLREVRVTDPGVLIDIDTPDDYWRFIETK